MLNLFKKTELSPKQKKALILLNKEARIAHSKLQHWYEFERRNILTYPQDYDDNGNKKAIIPNDR